MLLVEDRGRIFTRNEERKDAEGVVYRDTEGWEMNRARDGQEEEECSLCMLCIGHQPFISYSR